MTDLNKSLGLDSIPDSLKDDEATNAVRDAMNAPNIDHAKTNAATLALMFHEAIGEAIHAYDDTLKEAGLKDGARVKDVQIIAGLLTLAMAQAYAFSRSKFPTGPLGALTEIGFVLEATDIAKEISNDIGKALMDLDTMYKAGPGFHRTKGGAGFFGVIPRKKPKA